MGWLLACSCGCADLTERLLQLSSLGAQPQWVAVTLLAGSVARIEAMCPFALFVLIGVSSAYGKAAADNPAFMMVSGISGAAEMCLAVASGVCVGVFALVVGARAWDELAGGVGVEGAAVALEPCVAAVAAGDGRELWPLGRFLLHSPR